MIFISDVIQKVEDMQGHKTVPSSAVIQFLSNIDLSHVLPSKSPTISRKFLVCRLCCLGLCALNVLQWSDASLVWLTSLIWGEIYVRGMTPLGIWNTTNVRLFFVKHAQNQPLQITETVSNVVGGFLRRTSDTTQSRQRVV